MCWRLVSPGVEAVYDAIAYVLPRLWWRLAGVLLLTAVGTHLAFNPTKNPLEKYRELAPGKPENVLSHYSARISTYIFDPEMTTLYEVHPTDTMVQTIGVQVRHGLITSVYLTTGTLHLADVVEVWGVPIRDRTYGKYQVFVWNCGLQATARMDGEMRSQQRSLFTPISVIVLSENFACYNDQGK
jgi:hypothetical protein